MQKVEILSTTNMQMTFTGITTLEFHIEKTLEIITGVSPSTSWKQSSLAQCTTGGKLNVELK